MTAPGGVPTGTREIPPPAEATAADIPAVVSLMNAAYRGRGADGGWSSEIGYIDGDRINAVQLAAELASKPGAVLLLWREPSNEPLLGCVWLEPEADGVWYLGSLTVDPRAQNAGVGRTLLAASERWARDRGAVAIRMTVVNVRDTLLAWYARRGYECTGETEPFPYLDQRFGVPKRPDLHFAVLRKPLT